MRWRKLFTISWDRTLKTLRNPSAKSFEKSQLSLSPEIVNSTVSNCGSDTIALSFFLWCARQRNYFHDSRSFERMVPIVRRLTNRFGSVSGIVCDLESAGCSIKAQTFLVLLRIYWRGNLYRSALEAFDEMGRRNFVPNTFARNVILDVLFRVGHVDEAMKFLGDTNLPNFLTYNIALSNLCKLGDWLRVRYIFREMIKRGFHPNTGSFTSILDCCRKVGRFSELLQVLAFMIVSGKQLTVIIWTILIDCQCQIGRVDAAITLLQNMVYSGCSPTVVTYTSVIKGLFRAQRQDEVVGLLDCMLSSKCTPDLILFNVLMDCLSKDRRYDDAINVFFGLYERKLQPDSFTLSTLMSILCSSGNMRLLCKLVPRINASFDLVACNSILNILCKAGFPSHAVGFYFDMVEKGIIPDSYSYVGLLNALFWLGRIDCAISVYHAIVVNNPNLDAYVHTTILNGLIKRGKYCMAIRLFRKAVSENYRLDVVCYTIAIHGLFLAGMSEEACNLFDQMKQFGVVPNTCTYNVMLRGLCKTCDIEAVKQLLKDMEFAEVEMDNFSFNTIVVLLIKLHRVSSASLLFKKMLELGIKPNADTYSLLSRDLGIFFIENFDLYPQRTYHFKEENIIETAGSDSSDDFLLCTSN
ncbi:uncharacterized protein [Typha angustifolia]|uniref:uncharacterized protein n=1 Tax=Typha angustifolia TaxID=59011 RepID=UPI003C2AB2E2